MIEHLREKLKNIAADYAEIHFEVVGGSNIDLSKDNVENAGNFKTVSGNVRVLYKNGWGFASFNEPEFDKNIELAMQNAILCGKSNSQIALNSSPVTDEIVTSFEQDPFALSLKDKYDIIFGYNELLKHPKIVSTRAVYRDKKIEKYFLNTEGTYIKQTKTFTGAMLMAMAKDGTNIQRAVESVGEYGGLEMIAGMEEKAEKVRQLAIDLLDAPKIEGGKFNVLLNPKLAGIFAHEAFGHLSEADFLYENPRFQDIMLLNRRFGPEFLNIIDDSSLYPYAGYTPYDEEGIKGGRNYLIRDGKLSGRMHSRETAAKLGEKPTGNARASTPINQPIVRMTNTFIDNGDKSFDELVSSIDDGIYAVDSIGGMTNLEMFTFSAGSAYRIRNGKIRELLRDVVLSGNVFQTLNNITAIGNDLVHYGGLGACGKGGQSVPVSTGSPHISVKDVLIGGV